MENGKQHVDMEARVVEAAKRVFVRKGFEAATMGDVAAEVGIGRTALHYYYRTKERLFEAVLEELIDSLLPDIGRILDHGGAMLDILPQLLDLYMGIIWQNRSLPIFIVNELNRDPDHFLSALTRDKRRIWPLMRLYGQIEREMAEGRLRRMRVLDVVSVVVGLLIFPLLVRRSLTMIFLEGDEAKFSLWWRERRGLVLEQINYLLDPKREEEL